MLNKIKRRSQTENFSYFLHFLSVFTGIFLVMTIIIVTIMDFSVYNSVDATLKHASDYSDHYVQIAMTRNQGGDLISFVETDNNRLKPKFEMAGNTDVILYNEAGEVLNENSISPFSPLAQFDLNIDKLKLSNIQSTQLQNISGRLENYHYVTVAINHLSYPDVAYMTVLINVQQLDKARINYLTILVSVMVVFWIISVGASYYLAKWSRRPILANYAKQKAFVENASHELRTPLAVLQNRLENLFRKPESTIVDNSESIASSLEEVRNMRLLTTNLLNLARRDDGIKPELTDIEPQFFDDIFDNYAIITDEHGKTFSGTNLVTQTIKSDKTLLKQLMTILFDNALKYTDADGDIQFVVQSSHKNLYLRVLDNGSGIRDEEKKKIFDRFYRVDKARTRQTGGFGLGLSLAKQIIDAFNGTISVKDNQPKGTIFEAKL